jgi:methanogenic corrinoid protein MtbC1
LIRTYNDNELSILLNIALLNKNGLKISKIAEMNSEEIFQKVWKIRAEKSIDSSTEKLILSLIELNEGLFKSTLQNLIDVKSLEETFIHTLVPFLDRIGVMWLVGSIDAAQEHFISNLIRQKVISEIDKLPVPQKTTSPVMLFLPEHEWHEISLLFYHYVLRKKGIDTIYLGQSLPYDSLKECLKKQKPKALVTSFLTCVEEKFLCNYFKQLQQDSEFVPIYAGGYQIKKNAHLLDKYLTEIKDISDLSQKING